MTYSCIVQSHMPFIGGQAIGTVSLNVWDDHGKVKSGLETFYPKIHLKLITILENRIIKEFFLNSLFSALERI